MYKKKTARKMRSENTRRDERELMILFKSQSDEARSGKEEEKANAKLSPSEITTVRCGSSQLNLPLASSDVLPPKQLSSLFTVN